jgi:cytochrome c-type biogenesis protein CcmH/NrfG
VAVWLAALMLVAAVALFVAAPLTEVFSAPRGETDDDARRRRFEHERGLATAAIRELEFDHAMSKITDDEFHGLRASLETRALAAMDELDHLGGAARSVIACPQCGAPSAVANKFCVQCGALTGLPADQTN